jgi:hypothetical protein
MEGYAKIASRIASHPELGIYRRFAALNAQNILYLQAELHGLEHELKQYASEDAAASSDETRKLYSRDWQTLAESPEEDRRQWNTMCRIRVKLKEYSMSIIDSEVHYSGRAKSHQMTAWFSKSS